MDTKNDILTVLKTIPLFYDLSTAQLERIASFSDIVEFDPGDCLINEGARLDYLFMLLEGEVSVTIFIPTIGKVETSIFGPLDIVGWSGMTPIVRQRTGTVTATTHCILLRTDSRLLSSLCEKDHHIGYIVYRRIANTVARNFLSTRLQLMNLLSEKK